MNFKINNNFNLTNVKSYNGTKNTHINYVTETYGPPNLKDPETYNQINKDNANFLQKIGNGQNLVANLQGLSPAYIERLKNVSDYKQDNPNLSNIPLAGYTMGNYGCMVSSLMGIYYLYTGSQIDITKFTQDIAQADPTCGNADILNTPNTMTFNWGLSAKVVKPADITSTLENGEKILVNVTKDSPMGSGGVLGHYFVLDHINPNTGEIYIYNPNSKYEGYVTKEFLENNILPYLNTEVRSSLWSVTYNPNNLGISIPTEFGNGNHTVTFYSNSDNNWQWNPDTNQGKLYYNYWLQSGGKYDNGIAVYNDRYLIACTSTFGNVGDKVDFYLEDGTKIPCIIADLKSQEVVAWDQNPANKWGHKNGQSILEFEASRDTFNKYGDNPGTNGWFDNWGNKKVIGAINLHDNILK